MTTPIPINLAVEDELSEVVLRSILDQIARGFCIGACYRRGGYGYLKAMIGGFNNAAKITPFLILTDLDVCSCPPILIKSWLPGTVQTNLIFRVAVREVESWLLAHRQAFAEFAGIRTDLIPTDTDLIADPKRFLIALVERCRKRDLKRDIVPSKNSTARQGPNYNGRLSHFVKVFWKYQEAAQHSDSLRRAIKKLLTFWPSWIKR